MFNSRPSAHFPYPACCVMSALSSVCLQTWRPLNTCSSALASLFVGLPFKGECFWTLGLEKKLLNKFKWPGSKAVYKIEGEIEKWKFFLRAGEMAQQLRALVALAEDPGLAPSAHMAWGVTTVCNTCPLQALHKADVLTHMQAIHSDT